MPVPKAPIDKDDALMSWKNNIGAAWELSAVYTEPIAHCMSHLPHENLRLGVFAPYLTHDPTAHLRIELIRHFLLSNSLYSLTARLIWDRTETERSLNPAFFDILWSKSSVSIFASILTISDARRTRLTTSLAEIPLNPA